MSSAPADSRRITICFRRADMRVPSIPCREKRCMECGAAVWLDVKWECDACVCLQCALTKGYADEISFEPSLAMR